MRRRAFAVWLVVASGVLGALGGSVAVAVTVAGGAQTHSVDAQFSTNTPTVADHHECIGVDGMYDNYHYVYGGTETGNYSFLTGDVTFEEFGFTNVVTNEGYFSGTWTLKDPDSGQLLGKGRIDAVTRGSDAKGVIVGTVGAAGQKLVANFAAQTSPQNTVTGEFGGEPSSLDADLAVIAKGSCL
jgi:hypothetical protein